LSDWLMAPRDSGLFGSGFVPAPLQAFKPAPPPKPRQKPKIHAANRHIFSVIAPTQQSNNKK